MKEGRALPAATLHLPDSGIAWITAHGEDDTGEMRSRVKPSCCSEPRKNELSQGHADRAEGRPCSSSTASSERRSTEKVHRSSISEHSPGLGPLLCL